jgi:hypothetical protein
MQAFVQGIATDLQAYQAGSLDRLPDLPTTTDAATTARYIEAVLAGKHALPAPITQQVAHIVQLHQQL